VLPKSNHEEARQIQMEKGFDSVWLRPVESMAEVVYHLLKNSVYMHGECQPPAARLVMYVSTASKPVDRSCT
jgi:hypothetical protein